MNSLKEFKESSKENALNDSEIVFNTSQDNEGEMCDCNDPGES